MTIEGFEFLMYLRPGHKPHRRGACGHV